MAFIWNIMIEYHVLQKNDQNLSLAKMTVSDGVSPSPKGERGRSRLAFL